MTNEEAIQILKPFRDLMVDQHGCPISDAVPALDLAISALSRDRWISVEERLPEPTSARGWYLVALESGCVKSLAYEAKPTSYHALFTEGWHETASPVTHWRELPLPPKEDKP